MANTIVIMTDELRRDCLGCYRNTVVQTPHIDALAARGARFDCAYTPSPICVPARASVATGRHVHETRCWSNAQPYAGEPASWHHVLRDAGQQVHSFGKLHFRSGADDNGFTHEHHPLHVVGGQGWVHGLLRDEDGLFDASGFAGHIGPGEDPYSDYDTRVCDAAVQWIAGQGAAEGAAPWCLYISFLRPHYPLTCPPDFYGLYDPAEVRLPRPARLEGPEQHPVLQWLRHTCDYDAPFDDASRRVAVASYFGLCSFVDHLVGRITGAVSAAGLDDDTAVLFTSDHGECLGDRGFWTKMVMFEESAAVPLILAGPGVTPGTCDAPVSLIDLFPTVLDAAGVPAPDGACPHARSLFDTLDAPRHDRPILSEYHDYGAQTGVFMLRFERWKLVVYSGFAAQLFDLDSDPDELHDVADDPGNAAVLEQLHAHLRTLVDPDAANAQAFADQAARIDALGGREAIKAMQNYDHTPVATQEGA